jgi:DNA-binding MarR family transcriptional regulator
MNDLAKLNKQLQKTLTKEKFIKRIESLIKEGLVEIVDCEEDGTPIVNITDKGRQSFLDAVTEA